MSDLLFIDGTPIVDAGSNTHLLDLPDGSGYMARDFDSTPIGSLPFAKAVTAPPIPRSEWPERIADLRAKGLIVSKIARDLGVKTKNQSSTNYCWAHPPVQAMEISRVRSGEKYVELSATSVAAPVVNYQNVGNWAHRAVEYISKNGVCPASMWKPNVIDKRLDNPSTREVRKRHILHEWLDLPRNSFDHLFSQLLRLVPVPIGVDRWRHEILACDPLRLKDGRYAVNIWNQYGEGWGTNGMAILTEDYIVPFDAIAPLTATAL